jgi:hypothetical protein
MKNRMLVAAILILPFALFVFFWWNPGALKTPGGGENKISQAAAVASALANQNSNTVAIIESNFARVQPAQVVADTAAKIAITPAGPPQPLQFTNFAPATVLENVRHAIRQYGDRFGGNPVGNNAEITAALAGDNPKHINFISAEAGMRVNENGEMVDAWGTPFFFHQLSAHEMEIHSAGPDRIMWTYDDLVAR